MITQELPKKKRIIKSEQDNSVNRNVKPKKISNPQIPKKQNTQNSAKQVINQKPINKTHQPKSKKVDSVNQSNTSKNIHHKKQSTNKYPNKKQKQVVPEIELSPVNDNPIYELPYRVISVNGNIYQGYYDEKNLLLHFATEDKILTGQKARLSKPLPPSQNTESVQDETDEETNDDEYEEDTDNTKYDDTEYETAEESTYDEDDYNDEDTYDDQEYESDYDNNENETEEYENETDTAEEATDDYEETTEYEDDEEYYEESDSVDDDTEYDESDEDYEAEEDSISDNDDWEDVGDVEPEPIEYEDENNSSEINYQSNEKPQNRGLFSIRKKKPTKKPLQTIALFSSKSGSGCTHHAIALTKYLIDSGYKACYYEARQSNVLNALITCDGRMVQNNTNFVYDKKIPMYPHSTDISEFSKKKYQFVIMDYGIDDYVSEQELKDKDLVIAVSGSRPWDIESMHGNIANNMYNGVEVIMNFINPKEQVDIQNAYDMLSINFAEYEPDLFNGHNNDHIYEKLTHYLFK